MIFSSENSLRSGSANPKGVVYEYFLPEISLTIGPEPKELNEPNKPEAYRSSPMGVYYT